MATPRRPPCPWRWSRRSGTAGFSGGTWFCWRPWAAASPGALPSYAGSSRVASAPCGPCQVSRSKVASNPLIMLTDIRRGPTVLWITRESHMTTGTLTRADLTEAVFQSVGLSRTDSAQMVEDMLEEVCGALAKGERSEEHTSELQS